MHSGHCLCGQLRFEVDGEPQDFKPQIHAFFEEHIPWFDTQDDLPRES